MTENNQTIKNMCIALKEEADAIISYSEKMDAVPGSEIGNLFNKIRLDEMEHVQDLCLALTKMLAEETSEPEETEKEQE